MFVILIFGCKGTKKWKEKRGKWKVFCARTTLFRLKYQKTQFQHCICHPQLAKGAAVPRAVLHAERLAVLSQRRQPETLHF